MALREFLVGIYCTPYMSWQVGSVETEKVEKVTHRPY